MAVVNLTGSVLGTALMDILSADDIQPGSSPSYQVCKLIYLFHPLGAKIVEKPLEIAQSQPRDVTIVDAPEDACREAFEAEWEKLGADEHIFNLYAQSRVYGIASLALMVDGVDSNTPVDYKKIHEQDISFNVYDPLNTAGSLVLNQNPTAMDFQHTTDIRVSGQRFHRSRVIIAMNERPIYIAYTTSAFGYVGRSAYQRALYMLKSFVQSMRTDDMVMRKAGVLIAKMNGAGAVVDNLMQSLFGTKRQLLKQAEVNNVISIEAPDESIETLNMQNLDGAYGMARKNVLENIASAVPMPAKLLTQETFAEGFGEGTEDAKDVARFVDGTRKKMKPGYAFFDEVCMHRAWNPDFYKTIQRRFPEEYGDVAYEQAFIRWKNSFKAQWPSLLKEPDSKKAEVDKVRLEAINAAVEVLLPVVDPINKAILVEWMADNYNSLKMLFDSPLELDIDALANYEPPQPEMGGGEEGLEGEPKPPKPFSAQDSAVIAELARSVVRLRRNQREAA